MWGTPSGARKTFGCYPYRGSGGVEISLGNHYQGARLALYGAYRVIDAQTMTLNIKVTPHWQRNIPKSVGPQAKFGLQKCTANIGKKTFMGRWIITEQSSSQNILFWWADNNSSSSSKSRRCMFLENHRGYSATRATTESAVWSVSTDFSSVSCYTRKTTRSVTGLYSERWLRAE